MVHRDDTKCSKRERFSKSFKYTRRFAHLFVRSFVRFYIYYIRYVGLTYISNDNFILTYSMEQPKKDRIITIQSSNRKEKQTKRKKGRKRQQPRLFNGNKIVYKPIWFRFLLDICSTLPRNFRKITGCVAKLVCCLVAQFIFIWFNVSLFTHFFLLFNWRRATQRRNIEVYEWRRNYIYIVRFSVGCCCLCFFYFYIILSNSHFKWVGVNDTEKLYHQNANKPSKKSKSHHQRQIGLIMHCTYSLHVSVRTCVSCGYILIHIYCLICQCQYIVIYHSMICMPCAFVYYVFFFILSLYGVAHDHTI